MAIGRFAPSSATVAASTTFGQNPGGRPAKVTLTFLPLRGGGGAINPDVMARANEYFKAQKMPSALLPARSRALQTRTNAAISKGFLKPKALGNGQ